MKLNKIKLHHSHNILSDAEMKNIMGGYYYSSYSSSGSSADDDSGSWSNKNSGDKCWAKSATGVVKYGRCTTLSTLTCIIQ